MSRTYLIVLYIFLLATTIKAQSGYKDIDTAKYSETDILEIDAETQTILFFSGSSLRKIKREFKGSTFSSTTVYYMKDGKLLHSVYASLRKPNTYYEEHLYFTNGKLIKWTTSDKKKGVPGSLAFTDKEKLALHFFEKELEELKSRK